MAITRHSNFDKTVQTIIDRNNISNKVNGMMVVVLDAIADPNAGSGKAIYRWENSDSSWILVSKSTTETMNFVTEELPIVNGEVQLSYIPVDNQVWNGVILNGSLIYADLNIKNITISNGKITGLTSDINGLILRVTYAYGTISQQITTAIESSVDSALLNSLKTINGNEIVGSGNIEVTASLPPLKTINSESILGTGDIQIVTDISGKADKSTTLSGYGITNAYTKTETDSAISTSINNLVDGAPAALDTLKEIATQLANDESAVSALTTVVSTKANSSDVYTKAEIDNKVPDIISSEFNTGMKRGSKIVYGIEVDAGALTDSSTKDITFGFNSSYTYWLDTQNSYAYTFIEVLPLPYASPMIGESIGVKLNLKGGKIKITTGNDKTAFSAKIVILYTK